MASKKGKVILPENVSLEVEEQADFEKQVKKIKSKSGWSGLQKGVVYVGHIPHGFYEQEMRQFFSQFGTVTRLRLSRSPKTGGSRGYAFVEFKCEEVAKIVADTMNNYLMFERLLKCEFIPETRLHPDTFKGANRPLSAPRRSQIANQQHNQVKSEERTKQIKNRLLNKYKKKMARLAELGVHYELPSLENCEEMRDLSKAKRAKAAEEKAAGEGLQVETSVDRSGGKYVLLEDSTDLEIDFKTPPQTVKSTMLTTPKSARATPRSGKRSAESKQSPSPHPGKKAKMSPSPDQQKAKRSPTPQLEKKTKMSPSPHSVKKAKISTSPHPVKKTKLSTPVTRSTNFTQKLSKRLDSSFDHIRADTPNTRRRSQTPGNRSSAVRSLRALKQTRSNS